VIGPITWTGGRAIYTVDTPNSRIAIFIELLEVLVSLWNNNWDWSPKSQVEPSKQDIPSSDRAIYTEFLNLSVFWTTIGTGVLKRDRQQSHL